MAQTLTWSSSDRLVAAVAAHLEVVAGRRQNSTPAGIRISSSSGRRRWLPVWFGTSHIDRALEGFLPSACRAGVDPLGSGGSGQSSQARPVDPGPAECTGWLLGISPPTALPSWL